MSIVGPRPHRSQLHPRQSPRAICPTGGVVKVRMCMQRRVRAAKIAIAQRPKGLAGVSRLGPWFMCRN